MQSEPPEEYWYALVLVGMVAMIIYAYALIA
jgi:hypothetical protein